MSVFRIGRDRDGAYVLSLPKQLMPLLRDLPLRLRDVLERPEFADRVTRRLFPVAYADPELDDEYRALLGDDLKKRKLAQVDILEHALTDSKSKLLSDRVRIAEQDFDAVLGCINDLRLVLGTEIGIENDNYEGPPPGDPREEDFAVYQLLTIIQGGLLQATGLVDFDVDPRDAGDGEG